MLILLTTIHVIVCLFLILVVLLQQGKGADLSVFGGGSTQAAFGARGAATLLHKLTVAGFVAFILTTTGIGFLKSGGSASVMSGPDEEVATGEVAAVTDDGWSSLVVHRAPLNDCVGSADPDTACESERSSRAPKVGPRPTSTTRRGPRPPCGRRPTSTPSPASPSDG